MLVIMLIAIAETLSLHVSQMYKRGTRLNAKCDIKIKVIQYLRYNTHELVTNTHIHIHTRTLKHHAYDSCLRLMHQDHFRGSTLA